MTGPFLLTVAILLADLKPEERGILSTVLLPRLPLGTMMTLFGFAAGVYVLHRLFQQYVVGLHRMAEHLRLMHGANRAFRVEPEGPPEVRELADAANVLAAQRDALLTDVEAKIAAAKFSVEEERNRLAALVADLPLPVIVCNRDGRILLYNNRARVQAAALGREGQGADTLIGLGRSIYAVFDRPLLGHALETLQQRLEREGSQPLAHFVTATRGGQLVRVQVAPVLSAAREEGERELGGYVLTLENISVASRAQTPALWPLEEVRAVDLMTAVERHIAKRTGLAVKLGAVEDELWVKVDSYSLVMSAGFLAARLEEDYDVRVVRLRMGSEAGTAKLEMLWAGTAVSPEILLGWQLEPMDEAGTMMLREVTDRHGGRLVCARDTATQQSLFRIEVPVAVGVVAAEKPVAAKVSSRPVFYDFDLFRTSEENRALEERPLLSLAYTAFDTETTGLLPDQGDEIIQIGAVRIVNGRLLQQESFDRLVDPGKPLKPENMAVHGISDDMLKGQPTIEQVLPAFHEFCHDTVLLAHNAAFDMRFLQMKEAATGLRFGQPVLDTLLLSAVVHPNQESHSLEAIARRLGISVIGRHTALGDACVTAEVFLKLAGLLEGQGILTLGQAIAAAEKTYYASIKY